MPPAGVFGKWASRMSARLAAGVWVSAYLTRLRLADIPAYVTAKGDAEAGAVVVKVALLDGTARAFERRSDLMTGARAWILLAEGLEAEVDALLTRARARDPDLWLIELEDRQGRTLLAEDGLSD
jgi:hypothetical protein